MFTPRASTVITPLDWKSIVAPGGGASVGEWNVPTIVDGPPTVLLVVWIVSSSASIRFTLMSGRPAGVKSQVEFHWNWLLPLPRSTPKGVMIVTALSMLPSVSNVPVNEIVFPKLKYALPSIVAVTRPGFVTSSSTIVSGFGPAPLVASTIGAPNWSPTAGSPVIASSARGSSASNLVATDSRRRRTALRRLSVQSPPPTALRFATTDLVQV